MLLSRYLIQKTLNNSIKPLQQEIANYLLAARAVLLGNAKDQAGEVKRARELGFTWLKYHTDPFHNAVDQTRAMQEVAPPGFKIHYDVNFNNTVEHIVTLSQKLAEFPIAGLIEDPLNTFDMEGHKQLRSRCPLPIVFHHLPLGGREAMMGVADGYMLGHAPIGQVVSRAGLFESANTPFMIQNVGGNITRAMVVHMAAAFEQATLHHITDTFAWEEDVVHHPVLRERDLRLA